VDHKTFAKLFGHALYVRDSNIIVQVMTNGRVRFTNHLPDWWIGAVDTGYIYRPDHETLQDAIDLAHSVAKHNGLVLDASPQWRLDRAFVCPHSAERKGQ
jgi:hypothetical protein